MGRLRPPRIPMRWRVKRGGPPPSTGGGGTGGTVAGPYTIQLDAADTIALPVSDLTLFGHVVSTSTGQYPVTTPLLVTWSMASGPAAVTFSAPWSLITTVSFTTTGTYVFNLNVTDGTNSTSAQTTVTVNPESVYTKFYVSPTYSGGGSDGSAAAPWLSLSMTSPDAKWTTINNALASGPVIIYFASRIVGSDTAQNETSPLHVFRTDTGTNKLVLDGKSKYKVTDNAGDDWTTYAGTNRYTVTSTTSSHGIGVDSGDTAYPMNYTTLRGFECTGSNGRLEWCGSMSVIEYCYQHDNSAIDPGCLFHLAVTQTTCVQVFGNHQKITFRNNTVKNTGGEGLYVGGTYIRSADGGCPGWGNTHRLFLIESNTITDPGVTIGQADGIDMKAGLRDVTIRNNTIEFLTIHPGPSSRQGRALVSLGIFGSSTGTVQNLLVEQNSFKNMPTPQSGSGNNGGISFQQFNGVTFRNNYMKSDTGGTPAFFLSENGFPDASAERSKNLFFYNNTCYDTAFQLSSVDGIKVRNNIMAGSALTTTAQFRLAGTPPDDCSGLDSDYNRTSSDSSFSNWSPAEGSHSISGLSTEAIFVNVASNDFHLVGGAAPRNVGQSQSNTFAVDHDSTARPQGTAWDMGAYEQS